MSEEKKSEGMERVKVVTTIEGNKKVTRTFHPVFVEKVIPSERFKYDSAMFVQVVDTVTEYLVDGNGGAMLFKIVATDASGKPCRYEEVGKKRTAFMPVEKGTTVEQVREELAKYPNACIQELRSHEVILTDRQATAMANGHLRLEAVRNSQMVRKTDGTAYLEGGSPVYRVRRFQTVYMPDAVVPARDVREFESRGTTRLGGGWYQ